jgi:hypothetical protein
MEMRLDELSDALEEILPAGFSISVDDDNQVIIETGLVEDEENELVPMDGAADEDSDFDEDTESYDESDTDD